MSETATAKSAAKALLLFTLPLIMSGLFQQLFNWVDAFIVGNVEGELALAGIGATTSLYNLFVTVITGFTSGLAVYNTYSAVLRGIGNSRVPFIAVLISSGVNVVLDLLFVAGGGGSRGCHRHGTGSHDRLCDSLYLPQVSAPAISIG